jgi:cyclic pyranopterin phosphate synthase
MAGTGNEFSAQEFAWQRIGRRASERLLDPLLQDSSVVQRQLQLAAEVIRRIHDTMPLEEVESNYTGETAERWRYQDGSGEVGVISSVTQAFCSDCNRARLSTEGKLFTCLFATGGHDLRALVRQGHSDEEITTAIAHLWSQREDRYSELRTQQTEGLERPVRKVEMSYIGG